MTHPDMEAQVDAYLDGELAVIDAVELEAHLTGCASCGRFRDDRLALRKAITAQIPRFEVPEPLRARVRAELRKASSPSRARRSTPSRWRGWHSPRRRHRRGWQLAARGGARRVGDPERRGAGEPCALAHARPPQRRGLVRPAHREAVVQWEAGLLAAGAGFLRQWLSAARWAARISERAAGGGIGVWPATAPS